MTKWSYNIELFFNLPEILQFTFSKIAKLSGINNQQLDRYKKRKIGMSLDVLIDICNAVNIPIHFFIVENDVAIIPGRGEAVVPAAQWQPIVYDKEAADRFFGEGIGRIYWKEVGELMGLAPANAKNRLKGDSRFPVDDFLDICTKLQISPYNFIIDENGPYANNKNGNANSHAIKQPTCPNTDIETINKNIEAIDKRLSVLERKYDQLLRVQNHLASMYNDKADTYPPAIIPAADADDEFNNRE